ncbi:1-acyl-sn-glycerol-3-phosphate acyltransferase [Lutibacter sp. HS1-25]|uniref:lysophospholipid acyltransferase family protein n=1 Tax=Lutibacter sp. HS1-25 TaxID=2485000 RepID=UPI0010100EF6|nr:lysophospholipid acyltransferase family protein [Lutibacter sp. HS1-25]RXP64427.1 1-acyl-sn-glycerol-3-phosphate acyltransferase [Lutibacter sp. HS1-25]
MKVFKTVFYIVWRCWFYGWVLFTMLPVLPILLIVTSTEKLYPVFFKIAKAWANTVLFVMGFKINLEQEQLFDPTKSYMLCPNHTSMIDIMVMLSVAKYPFVFVGKAELTKIPIFGFFYKRTCIIVDRNNSKSRTAVFNEARARLSNGLDVCIFPEGLVPDDETVVLSEFKKGAFRLAIEHQIPIVPISFYDCKKRFSYTFFSGGPGKLRVKIHKFIYTEGLTLKDCDALKDKTFNLIYNDLLLKQKN